MCRFLGETSNKEKKHGAGLPMKATVSEVKKNKVTAKVHLVVSYENHFITFCNTLQNAGPSKRYRHMLRAK
jgi:hypothetical protein